MPTDFLCTAQYTRTPMRIAAFSISEEKGVRPGEYIAVFHFSIFLFSGMKWKANTPYLYHNLLFICTYRMLFGKFFYASTAAVSEI